MSILEYLDGDYTILLVLSTCISMLMMSLPTWYVEDQRKEASTNSTTARTQKSPPLVQIVVLGDIGRSPRMQYHALSIARKGGKVQLVGYAESTPHKDLLSNPSIEIFPIPPHPDFLTKAPRSLFVIFGPLKVLWQVAMLWYIMGYKTVPPKFIFVQNPPSIPTLIIAKIMSKLRNSTFIIDWHNFGHSILALKLPKTHILVRVYAYLETFFGQRADYGFAVTAAMSKVLKNEYKITTPIFPLHDRPPTTFQPLSENERDEAYAKFDILRPHISDLQQRKTRLLVSSTSWTPDEDFSILLEALEQYSSFARSRKLPHLLVIITGRGPMKEAFFQTVEQRKEKLSHATITSAWLAAEDYPTLLACADLGICMHTSSSGLDLPMKVVDMFGAGIPVLALSGYASFDELVKEGVNGVGFRDAQSLAESLAGLVVSKGAEKLKKLKEGALKEGNWRWDDEWEQAAAKLFGLSSSSTEFTIIER